MSESQSLNYYISLILADYSNRKINFSIVKRNLDKITPNYRAVLVVYFSGQLGQI